MSKIGQKAKAFFDDMNQMQYRLKHGLLLKMLIPQNGSFATRFSTNDFPNLEDF